MNPDGGNFRPKQVILLGFDVKRQLSIHNLFPFKVRRIHVQRGFYDRFKGVQKNHAPIR